MEDILTGTPSSLTYLHPAVQQAWKVVWVVVAAGIGVLLAWVGITIIFREHLGGPPSGWRELVPRLMIAVVAASSSLWWGSFIIDLADRIAGFVAASLQVTANDLLRAPLKVFLDAIEFGNTGMVLAIAVLYLVYGFFVLYVIGQFIIRLALIDLLLVLAPAALGLWVLPNTAGWGRYWLRTFLTVVFQQAVQLVSLALAFAFLNEFAALAANQPVKDFLWKLLLSIAFVYLTTRVPSMLGNVGLFDAWVRTLHYGTSILAHLPTALRVAGLIGLAWPRGGGGGGAAAAGGWAASSLAFSAGRGSPSWPSLPGRATLALPPGGPPALPPRSLEE